MTLTLGLGGLDSKICLCCHGFFPTRADLTLLCVVDDRQSHSTHMQVPHVALQPLHQPATPSIPAQHGERQLLWIGSRYNSQLAWQVAPPQQAHPLHAMLAWPMC
jgi:hypothetical protein